MSWPLVLATTLLATPPLAANLPATLPTRVGATLQLRGEFTILVRAPPQIALDLFGAHGERAWAGDEWDPRFLHPLPAEDRAGAVFLNFPKGKPAILGYTPVFDRERGHVRHVFVRGADSVTVIDIRLFPAGARSSRVIVVYERTALNRGAEDEVRELAASDAAQAAEWEAAINAHLASTRTAKP